VAAAHADAVRFAPASMDVVGEGLDIAGDPGTSI
jgi:hypothetical protein